MTAAELEKLLAEVDQDDFPTTRHNAKAELDKISVKLARRVIAAERIAEALRQYKARATRVPFDLAMSSDAALAAYEAAK